MQLFAESGYILLTNSANAVSSIFNTVLLKLLPITRSILPFPPSVIAFSKLPLKVCDLFFSQHLTGFLFLWLYNTIFSLLNCIYSMNFALKT